MNPLQPYTPCTTIAVAGLGNIGSQVVPLLLREVAKTTAELSP
jgi:homoserine dehydrogenase